MIRYLWLARFPNLTSKSKWWGTRLDIAKQTNCEKCPDDPDTDGPDDGDDPDHDYPDHDDPDDYDPDDPDDDPEHHLTGVSLLRVGALVSTVYGKVLPAIISYGDNMMVII